MQNENELEHELPVEEESSPEVAAEETPEGVASEQIDFDAALAEAEERGFQRAMAMVARQKMDAPVLFEDLARRAANQRGKSADDAGACVTGFLSGIRASVWD